MIFPLLLLQALPTNPILYCDVTPTPNTYSALVSPFGNHTTIAKFAPRGGDLMIVYPNGKVRNLTAEAGYGARGVDQENGIAVREPCVHWSGKKALFSMVNGHGPLSRWQIFEVSGLGLREEAQIAHLKGQPGHNNVSPFYLSDGRIGFTSDLDRSGEPRTYHQLDEYEGVQTVTGLWAFDRDTGETTLLAHHPSGSFEPFVDSYGRILFTRWDHLVRDQQVDKDWYGHGPFGAHDYVSETSDERVPGNPVDIFPELRTETLAMIRQGIATDAFWPDDDPGSYGIEFNEFLAWQINQDGTREETLNHYGRHEMFPLVRPARTDDPSIVPLYRPRNESVYSVHQISESPFRKGVYYATDCRRFDTHGAGQIVSLTGPRGLMGDSVHFSHITHLSTQEPSLPENAAPEHSGLYRDPILCSDGVALAVNAQTTMKDANVGEPGKPVSRYSFRIFTLKPKDGYWEKDRPIAVQTYKRLRWNTEQNGPQEWSGLLWQLWPTEVVAKKRPPYTRARYIDMPGRRMRKMFQEYGLTMQEVSDWLAENDKALMVVRDVTSRDEADRQQPYNLKAGNVVRDTGTGPVREIAGLELFQANLVRGVDSGVFEARGGRRPLAQRMTDGFVVPGSGSPSIASVASDGSAVAVVPARRAISWQTVESTGKPVVRERYWVSFAPGEIRACDGCHGSNARNQMGEALLDANPEPLALRDMLDWLADQ